MTEAANSAVNELKNNFKQVIDAVTNPLVATALFLFAAIDVTKRIVARRTGFDAIRNTSTETEIEGIDPEQRNLLELVRHQRKDRDKKRIAILQPKEGGNIYTAIQLSYGWGLLLRGEDEKPYLIRAATLDGLSALLRVAQGESNEVLQEQIEILGRVDDSHEFSINWFDRLERLDDKLRRDPQVLYGNLSESIRYEGDTKITTLHNSYFGAEIRNAADGVCTVQLYININNKNGLMEIEKAQKLGVPVQVKNADAARQVIRTQNHLWDQRIKQMADHSRAVEANEKLIRRLELEYERATAEGQFPELVAAYAERERLHTIQHEYRRREGSVLFQAVSQDLTRTLQQGAEEAFSTQFTLLMLLSPLGIATVFEKAKEILSNIYGLSREWIVTAVAGPRRIIEFVAPPGSIMARIIDYRKFMDHHMAVAKDRGAPLADLIRRRVLKPYNFIRHMNGYENIDVRNGVPNFLRIADFIRNWAVKPNANTALVCGQYAQFQDVSGLTMLVINATNGYSQKALRGTFIYMPDAPFSENNPHSVWNDLTAEQQKLLSPDIEGIKDRNYPDFIRCITDSGNIIYQHPDGSIYIFERNNQAIRVILDNPSAYLDKDVPLDGATQLSMPPAMDGIIEDHIQDVESAVLRVPTDYEREKHKIPQEIIHVVDGSYVAVIAWDAEKQKHVALYIQRDKAGQRDVNSKKHGLFGGLLKWGKEHRDPRLVALRELHEEWPAGREHILGDIGIDRLQPLGTAYVNHSGDDDFDADRFPTLASGHVLILTREESARIMPSIKEPSAHTAGNTGGEVWAVFAADVDKLSKEGLPPMHFKHEAHTLINMISVLRDLDCGQRPVFTNSSQPSRLAA